MEELYSDNYQLYFENIIKYMPAHIYWKNTQGVFLGCNDAQAKAAGLTREQIVGKTDFDLPWSAYAKELREHDLIIQKTVLPHTFEESILLVDGTVRCFLSKKFPLKNNEGKTVGIMGISFDITEQKRKEQEIKTSRDWTEMILESIITNLPAHVYWVDTKNHYLGCNKQQAKSFGLNSPEQIVGAKTSDFQTKENAEIIIKNNEKVIKNGEVITEEEQFINEENIHQIYLSKKIPLISKSGGIAGLLGISFDITEQKELETMLKASNERAQAILDNIIGHLPGHVYWKNALGVYIGCNNLQAQSAGFSSRDEMLGKTDFDMPWKEQANLLRKVDLEVMVNSRQITTEEPSTLADGKEAIFLSKKVPLYQNSEVIGVLGISFDITEQKRIEKELHETRHKLEGMTMVSASIAHEIRTPLASIELSANSLHAKLPQLIESYLQNNQEMDSREKRAYLRLMELPMLMKRETQGAHTFIDMLLMNINPELNGAAGESFSMISCVTEALARYPFKPGQKELVLWSANTHDFPVYGKQKLVVHVLFNLLKNALYYIADAGKGNISIQLNVNNQLIFIDTGAGMAPEVLAHIFERFYSQTRHGAGVGLTYCKMVMEALGGTITCTSQEGSYTKFILSFPLA